MCIFGKKDFRSFWWGGAIFGKNFGGEGGNLVKSGKGMRPSFPKKLPCALESHPHQKVALMGSEVLGWQGENCERAVG